MNAIDRAEARLLRELDQHWLRSTLIAWALIAAWLFYDHWAQVYWLSLGDTDDNMRLMQVRALLDGQGWYDLRQYRLNPPVGFDIHWSRLVDLPIAWMILILRPLVGTWWAERIACGIAPMLPLSIAMVGLSFTVRRLVAPLAWPLATVFLLGCFVTLLMFMPERIDHHGWQLAMLSMTVAGLADRKLARGGAVVGLASAVSLTIGLEMLPYAAMAGAILGLRWAIDREEAPRLAAYSLTLAGASALGFAVFASEANQVLRCDALTPVWLSTVVLAGAILFVLARLNPANGWVRLALGVTAAAIIAGFFAHFFPQCLGRPEQVSDELARNWLDNVREAKPIYRHPLRVAFPIAALPVIGVIGAAIATWRARNTPRIAGWLPVLLFCTFATLMLLWQVRAGPAAELLAIPGATALGWLLFPWLLGHRFLLVRVLGSVAAFLIVSGLFAGLAIKWFPIDVPSKYITRVNKATGTCMSLPRLAALNHYPATTIFTFVDLGPRLIATTHHSAIAGPYHRNGDAILDVQHAFTGSPENFRQIAARHGATLLLVCPNMSESTVYRARAPQGFYGQLAHNQVPDWLEPLPVQKGSPFRLFRIVY
ncbi:hypothetical protein BH09PSE4_BH09PSE4_12410 [soil metagenome]